MKSKFTLSFLAITTTGFAAAIAQIIILREFLVLFYGNELSVGIVWASWLLWNAVGSGLSIKWSSQRPPDHLTLALFLSLLTVMLPVSVLLIRLSGIIWSIPVGGAISATSLPARGSTFACRKKPSILPRKMTGSAKQSDIE